MHKNNNSTHQKHRIDSPTYTQADLEANIAMCEKLDALGIKWAILGEYVYYTDDEKKAMELIYTDKEVPKELADRIIQYHKEHKEPENNTVNERGKIEIN
jgi:hypothetical protein